MDSVGFLKMDPNGKDGFEQLSKLMFFAPVPTLLLGAPGCVFAIFHNFPFFRFLNFENILFTYSVLVIIFIGSIVDAYVILACGFITIFHTNSTSKWLNVIKEAW